MDYMSSIIFQKIKFEVSYSIWFHACRVENDSLCTRSKIVEEQSVELKRMKGKTVSSQMKCDSEVTDFVVFLWYSLEWTKRHKALYESDCKEVWLRWNVRKVIYDVRILLRQMKEHFWYDTTEVIIYTFWTINHKCVWNVNDWIWRWKV